MKVTTSVFACLLVLFVATASESSFGSGVDFDGMVATYRAQIANYPDAQVQAIIDHAIAKLPGRDEAERIAEVTAAVSVLGKRNIASAEPSFERLYGRIKPELDKIGFRKITDLRGRINSAIERERMRMDLTAQKVTGPKAVGDFLLGRLQEEIPARKGACTPCIELLKEIAPQIKGDLLRHAVNEKADIQLRRVAVNILESAKDPEVQDIFIGMMDKEVNRKERPSFFTFLGYLVRAGDKKGFQYLSKLLKAEKDPIALNQVVQSFARFHERGVVGKEETAAILNAALADPNSAVVESAKAHLRMLERRTVPLKAVPTPDAP
jgi:hypothetical protein